MCKGSLLNRTCSFRECRFFHLKGTQLTTREQTNGGNFNLNRKNMETKNRRVGLDQVHNSRKNQYHYPESELTHLGRTEQGNKEDLLKIGHTLEAIMKRLEIMESRQHPCPPSAMHSAPQGQPVLSPGVMQPGTQTQMQWGSQSHWPQTQTQY